MPSRLNKLVVNELKEQFAGVDTCLLIDFTDLSGRKAAALRRQLRAECGAGASFSIIKASLARRAFGEVDGMAPLAAESEGLLTGPTGIAYGADDPVLMARTVADWGKKEKVLRFKGGLLAGRPLAAEAAAALAKIPPKNVLMAQVVGTIAAPLTGLLAVAQGPIRKLLGLADALAKKQAEAETG